MTKPIPKVPLTRLPFPRIAAAGCDIEIKTSGHRGLLIVYLVQDGMRIAAAEAKRLARCSLEEIYERARRGTFRADCSLGHALETLARVAEGQ